ncbi:hypothetical protein LEP1GSC179_2476 [Leptospira santarosai str. MOR084]|uniref:Uncharacterized protein n=1 Tax=Leptospira santarosai str. MOR084 TaxID=1049984 RepID=A0A0E2BEF1_9LEPT|nr:hypothetical protein LEP1GSC179_2476 [Leptospira santarosai str. MOR084]
MYGFKWGNYKEKPDNFQLFFLNELKWIVPAVGSFDDPTSRFSFIFTNQRLSHLYIFEIIAFI